MGATSTITFSTRRGIFQGMSTNQRTLFALGCSAIALMLCAGTSAALGQESWHSKCVSCTGPPPEFSDPPIVTRPRTLEDITGLRSQAKPMFQSDDLIIEPDRIAPHLQPPPTNLFAPAPLTAAKRAVPAVLPPLQYDHPFGGLLFVQRLDTSEEILKVCPKPIAPYPALACAWQLRQGCLIIMVADEVIKSYHLDPDIVSRHEHGHCNGWPPDHAGARYVTN
jgi:hypothetical protein